MKMIFSDAFAASKSSYLIAKSARSRGIRQAMLEVQALSEKEFDREASWVEVQSDINQHYNRHR